MVRTLSMWVGQRLATVLRAMPVAAHCDIPCGIYDPFSALLAARTVHTMATKLQALPALDAGMTPAAARETQHSVARLVAVKEAHAQLCKQELLILWADFFTEEDARRRPELHATVWKAVKLCSHNKQHVDLAGAEQLRDACEAVSALFQDAQQARARAAAGDVPRAAATAA